MAKVYRIRKAKVLGCPECRGIEWHVSLCDNDDIEYLECPECGYFTEVEIKRRSSKWVSWFKNKLRRKVGKEVLCEERKKEGKED